MYLWRAATGGDGRTHVGVDEAEANLAIRAEF
jgi:hypothetical protein